MPLAASGQGMSRFHTVAFVSLFFGLALGACQPAPEPPGAAVLGGHVLAGPACPVVSQPPDEACADRPVPGAVLAVRTADGAEVMRITADEDGRFEVAITPGTYVLVPQPVDGLLGTAPEQQIVVDGTNSGDLVVTYDTGIR